MAEFATVGGNIYYEIKGKGSPLLLLRGLGRSMRYWLDFDVKLAQHYQVITLDYRGTGRSTARVRPGVSIYDLAQDVVDLTSHLGIPQISCFALSLGGMVALGAATIKPTLFKQMIIANSSIDYLGYRRLNLASMGAIGLGVIGGKNLNSCLVDYLVGPRVSLEDRKLLVTRWDQIQSIEPIPYRVISLQLLAAARFIPTRTISKLQPQIWIVYGEEDRFVPPSNSIRLAKKITNAKIISVPFGGHELPYDSPDFLQDLMKDCFK